MTYKLALVIFLTTLFLQTPAANAEVKRKPSSYFKETTIDDRRGAARSVLFIRRKPIVASIVGFDQETSVWVKKQLALYATSSSLPLTISNENANLVIIRSNNINLDNDVNPEVLSKHGISDTIISLMKDGDQWSSGCGVHNFSGTDGSLSLSIGLIDTRIEHEQAKKCASVLLTLSFGFGSGIRTEEALAGSWNAASYVDLLGIARDCDEEFSRLGSRVVKDCIDRKSRSLDIK